MSRLLILCIRFYQIFISPLKPPTCRFYPTCSAYAIEAIQKKGPVKGTWLAIKRIPNVILFIRAVMTLCHKHTIKL